MRSIRGWRGVDPRPWFAAVRVAVGLVLLVLVPVGVVVWMLMGGVALLGAVLLVLAVIVLGVPIRRLRAVARQISQDPLGRGSGPAPGPDGPT